MSYLDKAKTVPSHKPTEPGEIPTAKKANYANKASQPLLTPFEELRNKSETLPRLPWQLERLISAACADVLPETVVLPSGLVTDLGRYVRAWGCTYLVSDCQEAERRLWQVYRAWKEPN
jgi:hypothetical protein